MNVKKTQRRTAAAVALDNEQLGVFRDDIIELYKNKRLPLAMVASHLREKGVTSASPKALTWWLKINGIQKKRGPSPLYEGKLKNCPGCHNEFLTTAANRLLCKTCSPDHTAKRRWKDYGLKQSDFDVLWEEQAGKCAGCLRPLVVGPRKGDMLHIDHDHETMVIRGLLCAQCNRAIGFLNDSPSTLRRLADYLQRKR